jgi:hypothetical protein
MRVGDVFLVPTGDGRAGVGQVVGTYRSNAYYFALHAQLVTGDDRAGVTAALSSEITFLALSFDAKLSAGHWSLVGSAPVPLGVPFPAYREAGESGTQLYLVDHTGTRRHPVRETEVGGARFRRFVAPVRLERAFRASLGLEPWLEAYEELIPSGLTSAEVFG